MFRRSTSRRSAPLYAVALSALVLAFYSAPALAHHPDRGGKKAIGEVASFDGTTLTVTMTDGSSFASAVADDVQVKVEHRGHKEHGKDYKKPSNGSLEDLVTGAEVLRMKVRCDEVQKLRIRRAPADTETVVVAADEDGSGELGEGEVVAPETDDGTEVVAPETDDEDADDGCASAGDGSGDVADDDVTDEVEDLPPAL